jgi:hypothetical protein
VINYCESDPTNSKEWTYRRKDGSSYDVIVSSIKMLWGYNRLLGGKDITKQKQQS